MMPVRTLRAAAVRPLYARIMCVLIVFQWCRRRVFVVPAVGEQQQLLRPAALHHTSLLLLLLLQVPMEIVKQRMQVQVPAAAATHTPHRTAFG